MRCSRCLELPPAQHRPGRLLLLEYVSTAMAAAHRDAVRAPRHHRKLLLLASALEQMCAHHAPAARSTLGALTLGAPARAQAQALPAQYASILYCRPIEWTPGGEGFEGAACAAGSDYHVFVPSKGHRVSCSPLPAAAYGPHQGAHPRRTDRSGRALRGACAGWHVGGDPGLPPLGPELRAGLRQRPSSLARSSRAGCWC